MSGSILHYLFISTAIASMCVFAVGIVSHRDLVSCSIISGVFSFLSVIAYSVLKAPDVAITEVAVGSAISLVFSLLAIGATGKSKDQVILVGMGTAQSVVYGRVFKFFVVSLLFIIMSGIVLLFPPFGEPVSLVNTSIGEFYVSFCKEDAGIDNIVTMILGGYRGFDTLIEATVTFTAAFGVFHILQSNNRDA